MNRDRIAPLSFHLGSSLSSLKTIVFCTVHLAAAVKLHLEKKKTIFILSLALHAPEIPGLIKTDYSDDLKDRVAFFHRHFVSPKMPQIIE